MPELSLEACLVVAGAFDWHNTVYVSRQVMIPEMHFNASRSLTQSLLDCMLYLTHNYYDPSTIPSSAN